MALALCLTLLPTAALAEGGIKTTASVVRRITATSPLIRQTT